MRTLVVTAAAVAAATALALTIHGSGSAVAVDGCGLPTEHDLVTEDGERIGSVAVSNTEATLEVTYRVDAPWMLSSLQLAAADDAAAIPVDATGAVRPTGFAFQRVFQPHVSAHTLGVRRASADRDGDGQAHVVARATAVRPGDTAPSTAWAAGEQLEGLAPITAIAHPWQECPAPTP